VRQLRIAAKFLKILLNYNSLTLDQSLEKLRGRYKLSRNTLKRYILFFELYGIIEIDKRKTERDKRKTYYKLTERMTYIVATLNWMHIMNRKFD